MKKLLLTLLLSGGCCSTFLRVTAPDSIKGIYCPTELDVAAIHEAWEMETTQMHGSFLLLGVPFLIDTPFTFVLDTLLVPYDLLVHNNPGE